MNADLRQVIYPDSYSAELFVDFSVGFVSESNFILIPAVMATLLKSMSYFVESGDVRNHFPEGMTVADLAKVVLSTYQHLFRTWINYSKENNRELTIWEDEQK